MLGAVRVLASQAAVPPSHSTLTAGQSCHRPKYSCIYACGVNLVVSSSVTLCTMACQASQSVGFSRKEYWHGLPYPSRELCFVFPYLSTCLSTRCCQSPCDPSSCTTFTPGPHWGRAKSSRAASGANSNEDPQAELEIKPQSKPRCSVAKEEGPKSSHQLYKLQIKSTQSTRQTLCLWNI